MQIRCVPASHCSECGGSVVPNINPTHRHQVFEIPEPKFELTEYQVFHGRCQCCGTSSKGKLPESAPQGQMGPNLLSLIAMLTGQCHLSIRKIQSLLKEQYGLNFSTGTISEAQGKVSAMLTPTHQALRLHIQKALRVHADETTHYRNGEEATRWVWLMSGNDAVFQNIRFSRSQESAKYLLGEQTQAVVISDQCSSYNWIDSSRHQFCLAHVVRNLQQMADYSGQGLTAYIGKRLTLLMKSIFRVQHRYESSELSEDRWRRRMLRIRQSLKAWLERGAEAPISRYAGRCQHILKYEEGLWVFLNHPNVPLTNNEAERCLRGSVIMRKICYGTSSDRGDKFRSRVFSIVETCKKRGLSPFAVLKQIVSEVTARQAYPDVFGLTSA